MLGYGPSGLTQPTLLKELKEIRAQCVEHLRTKGEW